MKSPFYLLALSIMLCGCSSSPIDVSQPPNTAKVHAILAGKESGTAFNYLIAGVNSKRFERLQKAAYVEEGVHSIFIRQSFVHDGRDVFTGDSFTGRAVLTANFEKAKEYRIVIQKIRFQTLVWIEEVGTKRVVSQKEELQYADVLPQGK